jgi:hypothetical protein
MMRDEEVMFIMIFVLVFILIFGLLTIATSAFEKKYMVPSGETYCDKVCQLNKKIDLLLSKIDRLGNNNNRARLST